MTQNVGTIDRVARLVLAAVLFSSFFWLTGPVRFVALLGFVPLATGTSGFCPLYTILGIRTCPAK